MIILLATTPSTAGETVITGPACAIDGYENMGDWIEAAATAAGL